MEVKTPPAWSIVGRPRTARTATQAPGPGAYSPTPEKAELTYSLAKSSRFSSSPQPVPGPGAYDPRPSTQHCNVAFSRAKRGETRAQASSPAPGVYVVPQLTSGPSFSISQKQKASNLSESLPGPGAYGLPADTGQASPSYGFSKTSRDQTFRPTNKSPGPGNYELRSAAGPNAAAFPRAVRGRVSPQPSPGPGTYNVGGLTPNKGFQLSARLGRTVVNSVPGPGTYDAKVSWEAQSHSLPKAERFTQPKQSPVGPGSYTAAAPGSSRGPGFGSGRSQVKPELTPGPGSYSYQLNTERPGFTLSGRYKHHDTNPVPGPGNYEAKPVDKQEARPVFSRSARRDWAVPASGPGPGTYDRPREEGRGFRFGGGVRHGPRASLSPGPGSYTLPSTVGNRHYMRAS